MPNVSISLNKIEFVLNSYIEVALLKVMVIERKKPCKHCFNFPVRLVKWQIMLFVSLH